MNYRHAFHAGNFADLAKHAAVGLILDRLLAEALPLRVVDTHAGAGLYDLAGSMARKSGEAEAGIVRLMADRHAPGAFDALKTAVLGLNSKETTRLYPGSPRLIAERLRPCDAYVGAELQPEDFAHLRQTLTPFGSVARAVKTDGYGLARDVAKSDGRLFVLVDPPFERSDDYLQATDLAGDLLRCNNRTTLAIWTPLKDLETFDAFVRRLESAIDRPILVAEARLKPLDHPMRLNGCALIFINPTSGLAENLKPALAWIVAQSGDSRAEVRIWRSGGGFADLHPR